MVRAGSVGLNHLELMSSSTTGLVSCPMSLLDVRDNPLDGGSKVARFLSTLSGILPQLKQYYHNYDAAVNNCVPYYKQEDLQYTNPIGLRVWKARHKDCTVAMKFTRTYGRIVHDFLANEGMAPKLMSINELEGGWKVIEMEFVEGETLQECLNDSSDRQKKCIKERLKSVLSTMNTHAICPWGSAVTKYHDKKRRADS